MAAYDPLTVAFEGWFERPSAELPPALQDRTRELMPHLWDELAPEQRRKLAFQLDYQRDPSAESDHEYWFDFLERERGLKQELDALAVLSPTTVTEHVQKGDRIAAIRGELAKMETHKKHARGDYLPTSPPSADDTSAAVEYLPYPKAMARLVERLKAQPEEIAGWVYDGPKEGGLAAYVGANELDPPPRFRYEPTFGSGDDFDYMAPLMACWFRVDDVEGFEPRTRYITGEALIRRWEAFPGIRARAFATAKIRESRLSDIHPICGLTKGSLPLEDYLPPLEAALFSMAEVEALEAADFAPALPAATPPAAAVLQGQPVPESQLAPTGPTSVPGSAERTEAPGECVVGGEGREEAGASSEVTVSSMGPPRQSRPVAEGTPVVGAPSLAVFREMADLVPEDVTVAFVGDRSEVGLAANSMLEITARGETRRVGLAELDLIDRRTGLLNRQAAVFLGMADGQRVPNSDKNVIYVSRLRRRLRSHLGIAADPFQLLHNSRGWEPRLRIVDRRGAADDRAEEHAEDRTVSFDVLPEGVLLRSRLAMDEDEDDEAAAWLRSNGGAAEPSSDD